MYTESRRFYRYHHHGRANRIGFQVKFRETDLWIRAERNLEEEAREAVLTCRRQLDEYIASHPGFLRSLLPLPEDPFAPSLVRRMLAAADVAGVGPMAGVAGAIAQAVGLALRPLSPSIIVENGGDCYLDPREEITVGVFAGPHSPFTDKLGLRFGADRFPLGICTSSGTVGYSLSFGKADAATVVSKDAALADAAATRLANLVSAPADVAEALEAASRFPGIEGVLIIIKDKIGIRGNLELVSL